MNQKFQFVINDRMNQLLVELEDRTRAKSKSEVIKEALKFYDWVVTEQERGREVVSRPAEDATVVRPLSLGIPTRPRA